MIKINFFLVFSLINVLLNYWLIPEYGAEGAAIATVITEALIPLSCLIMIFKHYIKNLTVHANYTMDQSLVSGTFDLVFSSTFLTITAQ